MEHVDGEDGNKIYYFVAFGTGLLNVSFYISVLRIRMKKTPRNFILAGVYDD